MRQTLNHRPSQPNLVVGWASGLLQVWPAEDLTIGHGTGCYGPVPCQAPRCRSGSSDPLWVG
jgi:hypothetical protein